MLRSPSSAKLQASDSAAAFSLTSQPGKGDPRNAYAVHTWLEGANGFGVPVRSWYRCEVAKNPTSGTWTVIEYKEDEIAGILGGIPGLNDTTVLRTAGDSAVLAALDTLPAPPFDFWSVNEDTSRMDGTRTVSLHLLASEGVQASYREVHPSLVIRCRNNATDVFVVTDAILDSDVMSNSSPVRTRVDDGKPTRSRWQVSTGSDALFARNPIALAKSLAEADSFFVEFQPFNAGAVTATFAVSGLTTHLSKVAEACGWKA